MTTENLSTLKIHKLTDTQYNAEVESGNADEFALYLTPDEASVKASDVATLLEVQNYLSI